TERVNQYAHRFGYADGVGELDLAAVGQAGSHDILGNVPRHVGGRAVDLGRILAAEGAAAVTSHAAVGVHDNLASGKTGVAHGAADHETSGGIDVVLGIFVEQLCGDGGLDNVLQNVAADFSEAHGQFVRQRDRRRHQLRVFVAGIAKHHALVAGTAGVDAHRDVAG